MKKRRINILTNQISLYLRIISNNMENLKFAIDQEEQLIQECANEYLTSSNKSNKATDDIDTIINDLAYDIHFKLVNSYISLYLQKRLKYPVDNLAAYFEGKFDCLYDAAIMEHDIDIEKIPAYCECLHIAFFKSRFTYRNNKILRKNSKVNLIEKGAVYTPVEITDEITSNTINNYRLSQGKIHPDVKILDFACGTGRFYFSALRILRNKYHISSIGAVKNNLFAIDKDPIAINILRLKAIAELDALDEDTLHTISQNILCRNALVIKGMSDESTHLLDYNKDFDGQIATGFDIVVSNPPYLNLKVNNGWDSSQAGLQKRIRSLVNYFRQCDIYQYSIEGMLNYYRLSIEMMLSILKSKGEMGVICPVSLFADASSKKLRKHLLGNHKLRAIRYFPENIRLFDNVSQATNIFYLQKKGISDSIEISLPDTSFIVETSSIKELFSENYEIPLISEIEWQILKKLDKYHRLEDYKHIRNRRGELDLTVLKRFITESNTGYRLVRGNMIKNWGIADINNEFVNIDDFLQKKSEDYKAFDFGKRRLVCQQISNIDQPKRIKFVFCNETDILGNSCNYLSSDDATLAKLYHILNSKLLNWRFKVTSSNNHINNYELARLPIIDLASVDIDHLVAAHDVEKYICSLYGLDDVETEFIVNLHHETA